MKNVLALTKKLVFERRWGDVEEILDKYPALAFEQDETGRTLLIICARYPGASQIIKKLISIGADPNHRALDYSNSLAAAICGGGKYGLGTDFEIRTLIENGVDPNSIADAGMPALHWAISQNRPDYALLLLNYGADPYRLTSDSPPESAFDVAARVGAVESIRLLAKFLEG